MVSAGRGSVAVQHYGGVLIRSLRLAVLMSTNGRRWRAAVLAAAFVSGAGLFVHNVADLPEQTLLSPESLFPLLVRWLRGSG